MELIYLDDHICVAIKPPRVHSTDEPGGMPDLLRQELGQPDACVKTVHRLDRVVSGLIVLARTPEAATELSRQIREGDFDKAYMAVLHGIPKDSEGTLTDLLLRNKQERKTYVVLEPGKGVQEAILNYRVLAKTDSLSMVYIELITGRTHQIRVQFSSRGLPLVGDRKYSTLEDNCEIALWSSMLKFFHPVTGAAMEFHYSPPDNYPWNMFHCQTEVTS